MDTSSPGDPQRDRGRAPKGDVYRGEVAAGYHRSRSVGAKWQWEQDAVLRLVDRVSPVGRVLDVPFGSGRFAADLVRRGWEVTGLDSSEDMLAAADPVLRSGGVDPRSLTLDVGDARSLPYADDTFDLVLCVRFMQSVLALEDVPTVLSELRRVARSAVIVQLRDPDPGRALPTRKNPAERMEHQCSAADADLLLSAAGLTIVEDVREGPAGREGLRLVLCRPSDARPDLAARIATWDWSTDAGHGDHGN
jgi:ubiquinone/menaquinone biosynthesis C-methylase UbiE